VLILSDTMFTFIINSIRGPNLPPHTEEVFTDCR